MAKQTATSVPIEVVRQNFLNAATLRSQKLPKQNFDSSKNMGGSFQFTLPHAGFGNFVILTFNGTLAITGAGGTLASSFKAPYNLFSSVAFDDYLGINRITLEGYELHERLISQRYAFDENNSALAQAYSASRYSMSIGGGNGAAGNYPVVFSVIVPIALHHNTTEGSFPFTLPNGDNVITVNFNGNLTGANNEAFIKQTVAGFTVTLTGTVGCEYYYWDVKGNVPLPIDDFSLVHELRSVKTTNLVVGDQNRYTLRTGRQYHQVIQNVVLNDALDTTDVTEVTFFVDGNTPTLDEDLQSYLTRTYETYGRDFPVGMFLYDFWRRPWSPSNYGSLETSLTLSNGANLGAAGANTYIKTIMESLYRTSKILKDLQGIAQ